MSGLVLWCCWCRVLLASREGTRQRQPQGGGAVNSSGGGNVFNTICQLCTWYEACIGFGIGVARRTWLGFMVLFL